MGNRHELRQRLRVILLEETRRQEDTKNLGTGPPLMISPCRVEPKTTKISPTSSTEVSLEVTTLANLLDYHLTDRNERHFEASLAAEMLICLMARHQGSIIYHAITNESVYDTSSGLIEPAALTSASLPQRSQSVAAFLNHEGLNRVMDRYLSLTQDKVNTMEDDVLSLFLAFRFFDRMGTGTLAKPYLERVIQVGR